MKTEGGVQMKAMTILRRCRAAQADEERLQERIWQRRDVLESVSAPQGDPNGGSRAQGDRDKIGAILGDIDQLEREKKAREEAKAAEEAAAVALLDMVPDLENKVLYGYYVRRMDTTQIAKKEKYQASYLRKIKRQGEQLLAMLSPERVTATLPGWYLKERGEKR